MISVVSFQSISRVSPTLSQMGNIMANVTILPQDNIIHTPPPLEEVFQPVGMMVLTVIVAIIATVGLIANSAVIFIVIRYKDMHKTVNYAFANLAVTDLMLLLLDAVPTAFDTAGFNLSAKLGCNLAFYLQYVSDMFFSSYCRLIAQCCLYVTLLLYSS